MMKLNTLARKLSDFACPYLPSAEYELPFLVSSCLFTDTLPTKIFLYLQAPEFLFLFLIYSNIFVLNDFFHLTYKTGVTFIVGKGTTDNCMDGTGQIRIIVTLGMV